MSCNDNCNPCTDTNPCYEDCGCPNPTTFECVSNPGTLENINVTDDMNGKEVLAAIDTTIGDLVVGAFTGPDIFSKVTSSDTTTGYLNSKLAVGTYLTKTILNPGANEQIRFNVSPATLLSSDGGNLLEVGTDSKLRVIWDCPPADIEVLGGSGVTVTGTGPSSDPYIISINPSISVARSCFDNTWRDITVVATGNADVVYVSGTPKYRYRFDGTIEFKGSVTHTVNFGAYSTANRKRTITLGNIPTSCLNSTEQAGTVDLKNINYIDQPGTGDQITQQYGYIVRKTSNNIILEFQSAYISATTKTIVTHLDGAISYPSL